MSDLLFVFKNVDNIKTAIEMGDSEMVVADTAKLTAQIAAAISAEGYFRTYSALEGFGRWLTLWRLGKSIDGSGIKKEKALAGYVAGELVGVLIDEARKLNIGGWIYDVIHEKEGKKLISELLGITPDPLVKTIHYVWVDPLVLDLDGDGIEISPLASQIQFDTNGDGIKTGTAWVQADDGLLVWDRNGNGLIDSGRELFGDETLMANGQKAAHGFAALSELDVGGTDGGAGDGVFDAKDAQYASLRIWRDLNQDGISQANKLQTLAEAGVASIKLKKCISMWVGGP
ncbi:hypothetical protein [Delftia sp. PS-11]|uniref:hypothetical protein n=1 Tax=Delftia sp. PS-11 TaxID=2767222 RepID=UPI0024579419|nr:hypothetical protein [Delftia sp. PS-11]KAJ8743803.1 hypothetical protein H9T68_15390 [Delftia sp. PS-11]